MARKPRNTDTTAFPPDHDKRIEEAADGNATETMNDDQRQLAEIRSIMKRWINGELISFDALSEINQLMGRLDING